MITPMPAVGDKITSPSQLDALPDDSVIRRGADVSSSPRVSEKRNGRWHANLPSGSSSYAPNISGYEYTVLFVPQPRVFAAGDIAINGDYLALPLGTIVGPYGGVGRPLYRASASLYRPVVPGSPPAEAADMHSPRTILFVPKESK